MADELPPIVTRLLGDITGLQDALVKGKAEVAAWREEVSSGGRDAGERLGKDLGDGIQDAIPTAFGGPGALGQRLGAGIGAGLGQGLGDSAPLIEDEVDKSVKEPLQKKGSETGAAFSKAFGDSITLSRSQILGDSLIKNISGEGADAGKGFTVKFDQGVRDGLTTSTVASVLAPDGPVGEEIVKNSQKTGDEAGKAAGQSASNGISPLIKAAFVGAATVGPAAILTGIAAVTVGGAALIAKSNSEINTDYQVLGQNVETTLQNAVSPITGDLDAGIKNLESGLTVIGPELDSLFAVAGPDASQLANGLVGLVKDALPGITSGLGAAQPIMHDMAVDAGELGQGIGGFVDKLGGGAGGAAAGFGAITKSLSELLPDVGEITGDLANGLGPALQDVLTVATPVANALTDVVHAVPPGALETAAVAATALFTAYKVGTWTGLVTEGTTFTNWLKSSVTVEEAATVATTELGIAEEETSLKAALAAKAQAGLAVATEASSSVASAALGPWGALAGALFIASDEISKHTPIQLNPATVVSTLTKAYDTHATSVGTAAAEIDKLATSFTSAKGKTDQLTGSLTTQREQISTNAETTAIGTLAALGLTNGQDGLTKSLDASLTAYSEATGGASAYSTALDSVNGSASNLLNTEAGFTVALHNLTDAVKTNGLSLDVNDAKGAANVQNFTSLATSADKAAAAVYQSEVNTKGASQAYTDANAKLIQEKDAFIAAADKAGFNKDAVKQLANELYSLPKDIPVNVTVNTAPAYRGVNELLNFVNSSGATIHVYETADGVVHNTGMSVQAKAGGGFVTGAPDEPVPVIMHGREYVLSRDMLSGRQGVDPGVLAALRAAAPASSGPAGVALAPVPATSAGAAPIVHVYIDGALVTAGVRTSAQRYARRNSGTGLT